MAEGKKETVLLPFQIVSGLLLLIYAINNSKSCLFILLARECQLQTESDMLHMQKFDINILQISIPLVNGTWAKWATAGQAMAFIGYLFAYHWEEGIYPLLPDCYLLISMADWNLFRVNCWGHLATLSLWCTDHWMSLSKRLAWQHLTAIQQQYSLKGLGPSWKSIWATTWVFSPCILMLKVQ